MNVINTKGFKCLDKIKISKEYLLPKLYDSFKFTSEEVMFTDPIVEYIIKSYTGKEEGVRNLQRALETILSKLNIYNMYSNLGDDLCLPYTIKDFKIPYVITQDSVNILLKKKVDSEPEHMYL